MILYPLKRIFDMLIDCNYPIDILRLFRIANLYPKCPAPPSFPEWILTRQMNFSILTRCVKRQISMGRESTIKTSSAGVIFFERG